MLINVGLRFSVGHIDFGFSERAAVGRVCVCACTIFMSYIIIYKDVCDEKATKAGKTFPDNIVNRIQCLHVTHYYISYC